MADWTGKTCSVEIRGGNFCNTHSVADSPFPICERHLIQITRFALQNARTLAGGRK